MNLKSFAGASAFALATLAVPLAHAEVRYDFTALSSFDYSGESFTGSFSVVVPDFITGDTTIPVAALSSCSVTSSLGGPASCLDQQFLFTLSADYDTVGFTVSTATNPSLAIFYYFNEGDFSQPRSHLSQVLGPNQAGTVVVTAAVPEPGTWALALGGLAFLGLAARRRLRRAEARR